MTKSKGGLGRGLKDLIPDLTEVLQEEVSDGVQVQMVAVNKIEPNPEQPRLHFDEEELAELAESILNQGVLSPLLVTKVKKGYQLVSGERRLRAAKKAGLKKVPVLVRDLTPLQIAQLALIENVQRSNLTAYEEAMAYARMMNQHHYRAQDVADLVGKSRPHVANMVRLLQLPDEVLTLLEEGELSAGHARALLRLEDQEMQYSLANEAVKMQMSVRGLENLIADILAPIDPKETTVPVKGHIRRIHPEWQPIATQLSEKLQTSVRFQGDQKKGQLQITFYGDEDLTRILDALGIELY